jgi:O-antigen/teichoic acid export membrane protein
LARIYPPHIFAVWAVAFSAVGIFSSLATLRFDLAIITEKTNTKAVKALHLCIFFSLIFLMLLFASIIVIKQFKVYFTETSVHNSILLFCLWCFVAVKCNLITTWLIRTGDFLTIAVGQILSTTIILLIQIVGGKASNGNPLFLIIGSIAGAIISLIILGQSRQLKKIIPKLKKVKLIKYKKLILANKNFLKYSLIFSVITSLRERIPVLFLGNFVPSAEVSYFSQSKRICGAPGNLLSSMLRPVFFHSANNKINKTFNQQILNSLKIILWVGFPTSISIIVFSDQVTAFLLGDKWKGISPIISLMILPGLLDALVSWMDRVFDAKGRQDLNLKFELAFGVTSVAGLFAILAGTKNLFLAIAFQSLIICIGNLFILFTFFKVAQIDFKKPLALLFNAGLIGLVAAIVSIAIKKLI